MSWDPCGEEKPSSVDICGTLYQVVWVAEADMGAHPEMGTPNDYGFIDTSARVMYVRFDKAWKNTFLHECLHATFSEGGLEKWLIEVQKGKRKTTDYEDLEEEFVGLWTPHLLGLFLK